MRSLFFVLLYVQMGCAAARVNEQYNQYAKDLVRSRQNQLDRTQSEAFDLEIKKDAPYVLKEEDMKELCVQYIKLVKKKDFKSAKPKLEKIYEIWEARTKLKYSWADRKTVEQRVVAYPKEVENITKDLTIELGLSKNEAYWLGGIYAAEFMLRDSHNRSVSDKRDEMISKIHSYYDNEERALQQRREISVQQAQAAEAQAWQNASNSLNQMNTQTQLNRIEQNQQQQSYQIQQIQCQQRNQNGILVPCR